MSSGPTVEIGTRKPRGKRSLLEMFAVLILGAATVATAWCGFQASRWNGQEARLSRDAELARIEASELSALAVQKIAYDAGISAQIAAAYATGNPELITFLRENLVRPEFLPVIDEWKASIEADDGTATNLFANDEYLSEQLAVSQAALSRSSSIVQDSEDSADNADSYVAVTLFTAMALFFAGVTTSFRTHTAQLTLVTLAALVLAYAAVRLTELPVL